MSGFYWHVREELQGVALLSEKVSTLSAVPNSTACAPSDPAIRSRFKVMLVDDHPITRRGLVTLISAYERFHVCGEASDAGGALNIARQECPEVAIVDITLGSANGLELAVELLKILPQLKLLVVSMHDENVYGERALSLGARGYLMKQETSEKIILALDTIVAGGLFISDRLKVLLVEQMRTHGRDRPGSIISKLSSREKEVLQLIGKGFTTGGIARKLMLSAKTVDSYREHLKRKLGLANGAELVRYAVQWMLTQKPGLFLLENEDR